MKNNISQFNRCSACGACLNVCPVDAISENKHGLYYDMIVDDVKCIDCGQCKQVCPVNCPEDRQSLVAGYAGSHNDGGVVCRSSSGGAFHAIAEMILEKGGVVYGAVYSDDMHEVVFGDTDHYPLESLQKSKYVESYVGTSFRKIKEQLQSGRHVLYCGTPCQSAGLMRYLKVDYPNLLVCDFSCGGLPSHIIFEDYLGRLEKQHNSKVKMVDFRPKNFGWENHSIYIEFENGDCYTKLATFDPYYRGFLHSLTKREFCYDCSFSNNHYADIILADFWMYREYSDLKKGNGLSLILTNSKKGENVMSLLLNNMSLVEIPLEKASYNIKEKKTSSRICAMHYEFLKSYEEDGLEIAINKYDKIKPTTYIRQQIKQIVKRRR